MIAALTIMAASFASLARSQETERPSVGGVSSPQGAMIFYYASGRDGACGPNCSEWIATEGVVEWDTFKRRLAFMARFGDRKVPVVLNDWGAGNLNVATTLGKIIRDHGLDATVGTTIVTECVGATEAACFALKRSGKPLDARINSSSVWCDIVCLLILAGGVHRTLPPDAKIIIDPTHITNRLAPNVSRERQEGLQTQYGGQFRLYLKQMGVSPEIVDSIDRNSQSGRSTPLLRDDWLRLGIVAGPTP